MDRQPHEYGAPMAYGQQQQQQAQQYAFHPQHQQFAPSVHGPPFIPPHPSLQQFPFPRPLQQSQLYPHLPPPPHLHQQSPPSYPAHVPPHLVPAPFHGSAPPAVLPPSDPELQKRIDKLVEYAIKNGPEFEDVVREREKDNPAYSFLFGGEGHNYYHYKLYISRRPPFAPFNPAFPSSMAVMQPPNAMMNPGVSISTPNVAAVASASVIASSHLQQPPFPPFYEQQPVHQAPPLVSLSHPEFDPASRSFKGPRSLPPDVEVEFNGVLNNLTGTKESIKSAKTWFMQRAAYGAILAEALRDRVFSLDDSERQLHIVYLANDILFDSLQRRANSQEIDNEALAFRPVLGSMLARVFNNPQNKEENQSRLQKILQFWASKEVYDQDTILALDTEMKNGLPPGPLPGSVGASPSISRDQSSTPGVSPLPPNRSSLQWQPGVLPKIPDHADKQVAPLPSFPPQQFLPPSVPSGAFVAPPVAAQPSVVAQPNPTLAPTPGKTTEKLPPYPLFPPGLIPGMVRKVQIGSGVPYSPISPLDIPATIPPSNASPSEVLERVSKFFRDIGEVNPSEGPLKDDDDDYGYERVSPVRKGGACIPPPPNLNNADSETGTPADGTASSSSRAGLGANADRNEPSRYGDVYSSYRKQRSTNYHSSMSARSSGR